MLHLVYKCWGKSGLCSTVLSQGWIGNNDNEIYLLSCIYHDICDQQACSVQPNKSFLYEVKLFCTLCTCQCESCPPLADQRNYDGERVCQNPHPTINVLYAPVNVNPVSPLPQLTKGIMMEKGYPTISFHCQNPIPQKSIFLPFVMSE